jgi:glycosyltransferase involved in cell wall biosynthesis
MKVALVCEYFPASSGREMRGGVEARTYFVGRALAAEHDVTVYAIREMGLEDESVVDGMRVVRVEPQVEYSQAGSLGKRLAFMRNTGRVLKGEEYDVVDGTSILGYPPAWSSGAGARVATYHDVWIGEWVRNLGVVGVFGEVLERYVLGRDWSQFIAVSEYTKGKLLRQGIREDKITVAPNGIDVGEYESVKAKRYEEPTICAIARLVKYKRVSDLIKAAAVLKKDIPDLHVKIIGTGPDRSRLKAEAARLGLSDCVEFMGYVEKHADVLGTLKASHAFCLPSAVEGYGITVVEAMALGVPYVASDIPAVREASRGGAGGLLYKLGDVGELAAGLKRVLEGEVAGGTGFIGEYDWGVTGRIVGGVYERVAGT